MIFFIPSFFSFFFLRVCVSGCPHGVHANRKVLIVALFQRHFQTHLEKKRLKRNLDEGRKMEPGTEVSANFLFPYHPRPLLSLPLFPTLLSYTLCDVCILFPPLPFFSIQTDSQGTSSETQNLSPSGFLWRTFLCLATTFFMAQPHHTIVRGIREFVF